MAQHIKSEQLEVNEVGNLCTARKKKKRKRQNRGAVIKILH